MAAKSSAFWVGCGLVTAGVLLHLPMFIMGREHGYVLAGMPMDAGMLWGMFLIVGGIALAGYGLLPNAPAKHTPGEATFSVPEDAPLTRAHWKVAGLLAVALIVDVMKPASLGFVTPGMRSEYRLGAAMVAWLPFAALTGTVLGSFLWGVLADWYGRRASVLLAAVMFVGTSICGAMPSFWWNVFMCLLMGMAAGGMLPVTYALLTEIMPARTRGWFLVLLGGAGSAGGYLVASALSAWLQPEFGWRIMWFLNLPSGLLLVVLSPLLPESASFLHRMGRFAEARAAIARFGIVCSPAQALSPQHRSAVQTSHELQRHHRPIAIALTAAALAWGLVNFGLLVWIPNSLVTASRSIAMASALIAESSLIAIPTIAVSAWLYAAWSTKRSLLVMMAVMALGLLGLLLGEAPSAHGGELLPLTFLIVGTCGTFSILLPYTAESFPVSVRGRATGWVAGCSKLGGLLAQALGVAAAVPSLTVAVALVMVPTTLSIGLIALAGRETR